MKILNADIGDRSYDVLIEAGLLKSVGRFISDIRTGSVAVISDRNVWALYGETFTEAMRDSSVCFNNIIIEPGEQSKSLAGLDSIYESLSRAKMKRDGLIVAFGGGVTGDVAGFAAATWNRGISYIQIPTTLLAQVDSSVGGKTAVNLRAGKNLVGAFHQPSLVIADTELLTTLPPGEYSSGMAEVIKYAVIRSISLFERLQLSPISHQPFCRATQSERSAAGRSRMETTQSVEGPKQGDPISEIVYECCRIKCEIVSRDELDKGERMLLNFGHTFGHAIEKRGNYKMYSHGEAVAKGMVIAAGIGEKAGVTKKGETERLRKLLELYGLNTENPYPLEALISDMESDKKSCDSGYRLVLITEIGDAYLEHFSMEELRNIIK